MIESITDRKERIITLIKELFSETSYNEEEQAEALEEIASEADDRAETLREQLRGTTN